MKSDTNSAITIPPHEADHVSFKRFQWLGFFVGGLFPVVVLLVCTFCGATKILKDEFLGMFVIATFVGIVVGVFAYQFADERTKKGPVVLIEAIFSVLYIHFLVLYTEGPKTSIFAESYLYFLAIVGYAYGGGKPMWVAAIALCCSYVLNLWFYQAQHDIFDDLFSSKNIVVKESRNTIVEDFFYFGVFFLQLCVTLKIAASDVGRASS